MTFSLVRSFAFVIVCIAFWAVSGHADARNPTEAKCGKNDRTAEDDLKPGGNGEDLLVTGNCVVKAGSFDYGAITIYTGGSLTFEDANVDFTVKSIVIQSGGAMIAGSETRPIGSGNRTNRVTLRFVGNKPTGVLMPLVHMHDKATGVPPDDCSSIDKGISVMAGGRLRLFGARGVAADDGRSGSIGGPNVGSVSWTYLAEPAGPAKYQATSAGTGSPVKVGGETRLVLPIDVSRDWNAGDWIVVGTTSYSPFESEVVKIASVSADGKTVTLDGSTPLRHYHFGGPDPGRPSAANANADAATNYGVDERAEVGLLTRSIVLTAKLPNYATAQPPEDESLAWGGETRFCAGFAEAKLVGVELEKFGKDRLSSYPIHLHMAGDVAAGAAVFNSNSIHHSYNHCITVHQTNNVAFTNNVCARVIGHAFYQEKSKDPTQNDQNRNLENKGIRYQDNLTLGVMANGFGLAANVPKVTLPDGKVVAKGFWEGDYLARTGDGYYGLFVPNTDDWTLAVHGSCFKLLANGSLDDAVDPQPAGAPAPCIGDHKYYFEPPTGFWTVNPATVMIGNSVGGCQSIGKAFWYVPPVPNNGDREQLKFQPVGKFVNNRAHACYDGVFGETDTGVKSEQLFPKVGGNLVNQNLIARFDGFTATRIRNRGVWMRPTWFVFENTRVATSREAVSLVTSGGLDGNAPGVWGLLRSATIVGVSQNNVDRWGPCGDQNVLEGPGCVDWNSESTTIFEKGYASPAWNFAGFYIYDGPARIHEVRFVNFQVDPTKALLTNEDVAIQKAFNKYFNQAIVYEGDAALGWFQNNQSAYPVATEVRGLKFDGVDLRHQVFTEKVNFGNFDDGDKNTAVIDRDGTLTGFRVVDAAGSAAHDQFPISLNNLPFNAASNAVDECHAQGAQDTNYEGRPTSLISPANYGTLEFEAFTLPDGTVPPPPPAGAPPNRLTQLVTFTKDTLDYGAHQAMTLHSRNNQGIWEPKVVNGFGYQITAQDATDPQFAGVRRDPGFPRSISVGITDVVMPGIGDVVQGKTSTFHVRVGVCYTNKDGSHPPGNFEIKRGYRSWGGNGVEFNDPELRKKFNYLDQVYQGERCFNLGSQTPQILNDPAKGCPAHGIIGRGPNDSCPAGSTATVDRNNLPICAFAPTTLTQANSLGEITNADGTPNDINKWFYDNGTGMLFFYVAQDRPNAVGSTPLGSCAGGASDSACPDPNSPNDATKENYYTCPPEGCITYSVRLATTTPYDPGPSACGSKPEYTQPAPKDANQLAFVVPSGTTPAPPFQDGSIVQAIDAETKPTFKHRLAGFGGNAVSPVCPGTP